MRVLVLGGGGMLGHKVVQRLRDQFDVWATVRGSAADLAHFGILRRDRTLGGIDAASTDGIVDAIARTRPAAIINCIGIIKQLDAAADPLPTIATNALLPHRLHRLAQAAGARLVHISTDCVFSGDRGSYRETDESDARDLYGRSKFLGEVRGDGAITLRTSIIGRELRTTAGLVEWFLSNRGGRVRGYRRAIFSGLTTIELADVIAMVLSRHEGLSGLWQVASEPINKFELLGLLDQAFGAGVAIEPDDAFVLDRSLDGTRFRERTGFEPKAWPLMVRELAADPTQYEEWRASGAA